MPDLTDQIIAKRQAELDAATLLSPAWEAAQDRLLIAINEHARAEGLVYVREVDLGVRFEPNDPQPLLLRRGGRAVLYLRRAHG